jgi:hypothetical protein
MPPLGHLFEEIHMESPGQLRAVTIQKKCSRDTSLRNRKNSRTHDQNLGMLPNKYLIMLSELLFFGVVWPSGHLWPTLVPLVCLSLLPLPWFLCIFFVFDVENQKDQTHRFENIFSSFV